MNKTAIILFIIVIIAILYLFYLTHQNKKMWQGQMGLNAVFMNKLGISSQELAQATMPKNDPIEQKTDQPQNDDALENDASQKEDEAAHQQAINKGIEIMAERIIAGDTNFSADELQFYENYKKEIELKLQQEKAKSDSKEGKAGLKKRSKKTIVVVPDKSLVITKVLGVYPNKGSQKFTLIISNKTNDTTYRSFIQEWSDVFETIRSSDK